MYLISLWPILRVTLFSVSWRMSTKIRRRTVECTTVKWWPWSSVCVFHFLILENCPKLCYFIHEYAWFRLDIPPIFEKLAKNSNDRGRATPWSSAPLCHPLHGCSKIFLTFLMKMMFLIGTLGFLGVPSKYFFSP